MEVRCLGDSQRFAEECRVLSPAGCRDRCALVRRIHRRFLILALLAVAGPDRASTLALERLQRRFGVDEGLPFSEVQSLAQDTRGFIWIGTSGGALFRYDGIEMRSWPPGAAHPYFTDYLAAGPDGEVLVTDDERRLFEIAGEEVKTLSGPNGSTVVLQYPPAFDAQGNLWIVSERKLWIRHRGGAWREIPPSSLGGEEVTGVNAARDGSVLVITRSGLWRAGDGPEATRIASVEGVNKTVLRTDGSVAALVMDGRVLEVRNGTAREIYHGHARPIDILERGDTLWLTYDTKHVVLRPGEQPEILDPANDLPAGGPLLVDREGSLWAGTFWGLRQFPSPDTIAWGRTAPGDRRLALGPEGIWSDGWGGLILMRREGEAFRPELISGAGTSPICVTPDGALWAGYRGRFLERRDGRFIEHPYGALRWAIDCAVGEEGRVWLTSNAGLILASPGPRGSTLHDVAGSQEIEPGGHIEKVLEDSAGWLWASFGDRICRAEAGAASAGGKPEWRCTRLETAGEVVDLEQLASGSIWAATFLDGVHAWNPQREGWEPIAGSSHLPTRLVRKIRPSPSGGAWIVTFGTIVRVVERPDTAEGWEIVERLSAWHGLMISDAEDLLEEPSRDLWIGTLAGLVRVPSGVRREVPAPPPVELVDVLQDGVRLARRDSVKLPWRRNRIELRFAALSYRDPSLLRYQVRLGPEAAWTDASGPPTFRFVDLPPGSYHAEVRASLDGRNWSERSAGFSFSVLPPFWRTWWFNSLAVFAAVSAAYALYRYRLAHLLKLERVRTRIAADLHDDIGASLSRIALQTELLRRRPSVDAPESDRLLVDIGDSARALVDSMSDIVWSIDPRRDDLKSVVTRLRRFALGLMEPEGILLDFPTPEGAEKVRLPPEHRRHLYLILKEAVNNAVRHAGCRSVRIGLRWEGGRLHAEVADDGRGFEPVASRGSSGEGRGGRGLQNMAFRAEEMGGSFDVRSGPGSGTLLSLIMPVRSQDA